MIGGALGGLLIAIAYTLATGKLQLTKHRTVYGTPARVSAILGLVPLAILTAYVVISGRSVLQAGGLGLLAGTLAACVLVIYGCGWPYGEPPR